MKVFGPKTGVSSVIDKGMIVAAIDQHIKSVEASGTKSAGAVRSLAWALAIE
ncbi:hypothetical protein D3C87_2075600 [compost metagenome]